MCSGSTRLNSTRRFVPCSLLKLSKPINFSIRPVLLVALLVSSGILPYPHFESTLFLCRLENQQAAEDIIERLHGSNVLGWSEKLNVQLLGAGSSKVCYISIASTPLLNPTIRPLQSLNSNPIVSPQSDKMLLP